MSQVITIYSQEVLRMSYLPNSDLHHKLKDFNDHNKDH